MYRKAQERVSVEKSGKKKNVKLAQSKTYGPKPTQRAAIDSYGWDTVYAMRFDKLNQVIANTGVSPENFLEVDPPAPDDPSYRISGNFDAWRMATGGSGEIVCMELPIPALTYESLDDDPAVIDVFDDVVAKIKLRFEDVPQPASDQPSIFKKPGKVVEIRFPRSANSEVIDSVQCEYFGATEPSATQKIVINSMLQSWLDRNCQKFNMVFASINLNSQAGIDDFDWMMPTHVGYAVRDDIFGVLCMTQDRPASRTHDVSPEIIPQNQDSGFLISPSRYLENVVLKHAYLMFSGATKDDFRMRSDGILENSNPITLSELVTEDGKTFQPKIKPGRFTMRIIDAELEMKIENMSYTVEDWLGPYDVVMTTTSRGAAVLNDTGQLTVEMTDGETDGMIDASLKRRIIEIAIPVVSAVLLSVLAFGAAGAAAGPATAAGEAAAQGGAAAAGNAVAQSTVLGLTPRIWALIGAIVGTLAGGGWAAIQVSLEEKAKQAGISSPTLDDLMEDVVGSVQWPGGTDFLIKSAEFNNGLQIGIEHLRAQAVAKLRAVSNA